MTTKYLLSSSLKHILGDLAACSSRNKVFFIKNGELMCQIFAQRETPETSAYTHYS